MGEMMVQVGRYKRKDGTWVRGYTKIVPTADRNLQKVSKSGGGVRKIASREVESQDVIFALNPETSPWAREGFTHDSNWLFWHVNGYSPKEAARNQKAGRQPVSLEYGKLFDYVKSNPNFDWKNFPVQHLTDISYLFETWDFNEPIEHFDVSNIAKMQSLFEENEVFNQPLNEWNVSNVENMHAMFAGAATFNQPLDGWDVSKVKNMRAVFTGAATFNQPLDNWDVSKVQTMRVMFFGADNFDQNLGGWDISNITDMHDMFALSGMSAKNISLTLQGWATLAQTKGVQKRNDLGRLPMKTGKMNKKGKVALKYLAEEHGWKYRIETEADLPLWG